jgi:NAD(P)-dependent dehydrogenase (short-subunit alcohol dehydrogenase family)
MMNRFVDRVAIVTGAASGIGLATAKTLAGEGARVVIVDLDPARTKQAASEAIRAGAPDVLAAVCDVSKEPDVVRTMDETIARFRQVDVLVNNAGRMVFKPLEQHTERDWFDILNVDLLGAFFFIKQCFLRMKPGSAIVNVSSIHAEETTPLVASYAAAKAALVSLTRSAALEGRARGLRVNCVLPGAIDTPMLWTNPNIRSGEERIEHADVGKPEDVARAIAYLASDDAGFVRGAMLRVDGGRLDRL